MLLLSNVVAINLYFSSEHFIHALTYRSNLLKMIKIARLKIIKCLLDKNPKKNKIEKIDDRYNSKKK